MAVKSDQQRMIEDIISEVAFTRSMIGRDHLEQRVMDVMSIVPRDRFVPDDLRHAAFENGPLPIGHGQTISQPYIVALMTDLLATQPDYVILEIGTGSGYQTAILSLLCKQVYTMELVPELSRLARQRFESMDYQNIESKVGNGYQGWPEHAPYDGIIVTAAVGRIPQALTSQLKPGGRLVIPVGEPYSHQELMLLEKDSQGKLHVQKILDVAFVPLVDRMPNGEDSISW